MAYFGFTPFEDTIGDFVFVDEQSNAQPQSNKMKTKTSNQDENNNAGHLTKQHLNKEAPLLNFDEIRKQKYELAKKALNKYSLKSLSGSVNVEKTEVDEDDIDDYIKISLNRTFKDACEEDKQKIRSIKTISYPMMNKCEFEVVAEQQDTFKVSLIKVIRTAETYMIFNYSYNQEIKLTKASSCWRSLFGDKNDSFILNELLGIFDNNMKNVLVFLISHAANMDIDTKNASF